MTSDGGEVRVRVRLLPRVVEAEVRGRHPDVRTSVVGPGQVRQERSVETDILKNFEKKLGVDVDVVDASPWQALYLLLGSGGIRLGINYSMLNETKWYN